MLDKIKVLVVDDSALVRKIICDILESDPDIVVVGTANNGKTAIFKNDSLNPDVITMDIEMPIMDGLEALRQIIATNPKPVIMMSALTNFGAEATFKSLEYGAVDFVPKPSPAHSFSLSDIADLLKSKVKAVCKVNVKVIQSEAATPYDKDADKFEDLPADLEEELNKKKQGSNRIVTIGTSTGGPAALSRVFQELPFRFPSSVLVVQHMPEGFTKAFAERLNNDSNLKVKEAEDGDPIKPGCGYLAPGHSHMTVEDRNGDKVIRLSQGEKVSGHKPSIDVLFNSVADAYRKNCVAVIMTGMGKDGADGILNIKNKGGYTIAQDEETSVVFGMNRVAVQLGAINEVVSLFEIAKKIVEHL